MVFREIPSMQIPCHWQEWLRSLEAAGNGCYLFRSIGGREKVKYLTLLSNID